MGPCDSTLELPLSLSKVRPLFLFCSSRGGGDFCYVLQLFSRGTWSSFRSARGGGSLLLHTYPKYLQEFSLYRSLDHSPSYLGFCRYPTYFKTSDDITSP